MNTETKRPLIVGDKIYRKEHSRWGSNIYYNFCTVERLTKTQAVLSNGTKLINEPVVDGWGDKKEIVFCEYGDKYNKWQIQTDEIIKEAAIENERQRINKWFEQQKFTDEQKSIIYKALSTIKQATE